MNVAALLYDVAREFNTKTAIIENGKEISYQNLWNTVEKFSSAFYNMGIRENHRIALMLPSCNEFICCFFALLKNNAIISPLSPDLMPFELKNIFNNLNPHAIISIQTTIKKILKESPCLLDNKTVILQSDIGFQVEIKNRHELEDLFNLQLQSSKVDNILIDDENLATINYTYRGLGYPLGAKLSHKNYINGIVGYQDWTKSSPQDRVLSLLPSSHVFPLMGCVLVPLMSGATVILSRNYMPRSIIKIIDNYKVNRLTAVPSIYKLLLQSYTEDEYDISSLTCCITGGSYMPHEVQKAINKKFHAEVLQGYGLTECLPISCNTVESNKPGTLGLPGRRDIEIRIIGEDGAYKEPNRAGEIVINSPTTMQGYYNCNGETESVLKDGWLSTGDYGYLDEEGYLYFAGLKKNIAKVGGNTVDLKEVQDVILSHPSVSNVSVYAKEDDLWGCVVAAEVAPRPGNGALTASEVQSFCGQRLSRYKVPKVIEVII